MNDDAIFVTMLVIDVLNTLDIPLNHDYLHRLSAEMNLSDLLEKALHV